MIFVATRHVTLRRREETRRDEFLSSSSWSKERALTVKTRSTVYEVHFEAFAPRISRILSSGGRGGGATFDPFRNLLYELSFLILFPRNDGWEERVVSEQFSSRFPTRRARARGAVFGPPRFNSRKGNCRGNSKVRAIPYEFQSTLVPRPPLLARIIMHASRY